MDAVKLEPEPVPFPQSQNLPDALSKIPLIDRTSKQQAIEKWRIWFKILVVLVMTFVFRMERQHDEVLNETLKTQKDLLETGKKFEVSWNRFMDSN